MAILPPSASASSKICFTNDASAGLGISKIEYTVKQDEYFTAKYTICDAERVNLNAQNLGLQTEIDGLKQDKTLLNTAVVNYKKDFIDANAAMVKSESNKPSRLTWFGAGALTAVILGLAAAIAVKY
jgi:hypothetical protein